MSQILNDDAFHASLRRKGNEKNDESWRFNLAEARLQLAAMPDNELHALFVRHLNYIPGSSWVCYGYGWDHELSEDSWREMRAQLKCYRENCPEASFRSKKVRVPIDAAA
jgi:hypothetical protein